MQRGKDLKETRSKTLDKTLKGRLVGSSYPIIN